MKLLSTTILAVAGSIVIGAAVHAEPLAPFAGRSVALGEMRGTAYYRPSDAGFEVVITLADGPAGRPVRFVATLSPGQSAVISAPGQLGQEATSITMTRNGDRLLVDDGVARAPGEATLVEDDPSTDRLDAR